MQRNVYWFLLLFATAVFGCGPTVVAVHENVPRHASAPPPPPAPAPASTVQEATYQSFYDELSPYGTWIDYPGYGKSTGKFDEQTLYAWAKLLYKLARSRYPADSIIVYGKSLGTGIAAQLASTNNCKRLILETPYYSLTSMAKRYFFMYPVDWMIHYKIPTWQYLQKVEVPITIFHGTNDGLIPYRNCERLKKLLKKEDEFISIENGSHNDLYTFPQTVSKLDSLLELN